MNPKRSGLIIGFAVCMVACMVLSAFAQDEDLFDLRKTGFSVETPLDAPAAPEALSAVEEQGVSSPINAPEEIPMFDESLFEDESMMLEGGEDTDLISINFENVDIRDVIRILANKGQVNMVVGPDVSATVNLQLTNVTWEKAMEVVLMTYNLTFRKDGDLYRIMTLDQMQLEDEKIPLETRVITLNFARAGDIKSNFENMLSSRGRIDVNARTNSLIVTDLPDTINQIEEIAVRLDTRTPQVMIEALIADVGIDTDDQFGINWDIVWSEGLGPGESGNTASYGSSRGFAQSFSNLSSVGQIIFGTSIMNKKDLAGVIAFWQRQSRVNVLAHPKILTLDNLKAEIDLTDEIPYTQTTESTDSSKALTSTAFKEAGIKLEVTPHVTTKDNYVFLELAVSQSFQSGTTSDGQPTIASRSANTNLLVRNEETAVIGGLRRTNDSFAVEKIPVMGDIPFVGGLFRKRVEDVTDTDLMIFVTPTIVEEFILDDKQQDRLELFQEEPEDWVGQFDRVKKKKKIDTSKIKAAKQNLYLRPPVLPEGKP